MVKVVMVVAVLCFMAGAIFEAWLKDRKVVAKDVAKADGVVADAAKKVDEAAKKVEGGK